MDLSKIDQIIANKMGHVLNDQAKDSKKLKDLGHVYPNMSANQAARRNDAMMNSGSGGSSSTKPNKELRDADKSKSSGGSGPTFEKGATAPGGPIKALKEEIGPQIQKAQETMKQAMLNNQTNHNGSFSIRGRITIVDYPWMKAKEGVTVLNVGPKASGDWYVQRVGHEWDSGSGYKAECRLMRVDTKKDQTSNAHQAGSKTTGGAPIIRYAEIFQKNHVYRGPRKLNAASQATFTVGDGKHVVEFDWTLDVQSPKGSGQGMQNKNKVPNSPQKDQKLMDEFYDLI
jgi:hypothetical protein